MMYTCIVIERHGKYELIDGYHRAFHAAQAGYVIMDAWVLRESGENFVKALTIDDITRGGRTLRELLRVEKAAQSADECLPGLGDLVRDGKLVPDE